MTPGDDQRIGDILDACDELSAAVALRSVDRPSDPVLLRAAERLLEIIGEAASNVSHDAIAAHPDVDWRSIVLAHRPCASLSPH
jgi:uncharacterized protein with HEPN domain